MRRCAVVVLGLVVCLVPSEARANIGLPMIAILLPPAWGLLLPVIVLEAGLGAWRHSIPFGRAIPAQAAANLFSTLVGLPVGWFLLAILQLTCCGTALGLHTPLRRVYAVTIQAPWLIPYESDFWWMIPAAAAVLVVLFCALSIACE
jgi:hypothetical protein